MDLLQDLGRAFEQGLQASVQFVETNSALLATTLSLDKLSEFDGLESLRVIYSEDGASLAAMTELLLLHEQCRSLAELVLSYSQTLADAAQAGQAFGEALEKLSVKNDPRTETLLPHALSLQMLARPLGQHVAPAGGSASPGAGSPRRDAPPEQPSLPPGLSTIQQLLCTLSRGQTAAHTRLLELAEASPSLPLRALEALKASYASDVKALNDSYMEAKRRWRYSLSQAVAHRHAPEEASRFESEAALWRRKWEATAPELVEAARRVTAEHTPRVTKVLASWVQLQLKAFGKSASELQREEYKGIQI